MARPHVPAWNAITSLSPVPSGTAFHLLFHHSLLCCPGFWTPTFHATLWHFLLLSLSDGHLIWLCCVPPDHIPLQRLQVRGPGTVHSLKASWESHLTPAPPPAKLAPLTCHLTGAEQLDEENARRICWEWLNLHAGVRMTEWPVNLHTHMHANQSPNMCVHMCVSHKTLFPPIRMEALRAEIFICFVFQKRVLAHGRPPTSTLWMMESVQPEEAFHRESCLHWHLLWWTYFGAEESLLGWAPGWYPNSMK